MIREFLNNTLKFMPPLRVPQRTHEKFLGSLAVPDTEPWWIAVNYILDCAEAETVRQSRQSTMNTNMVLNAVGAGEGIALVRTKLSEARAQALKGYQNASQIRTGT